MPSNAEVIIGVVIIGALTVLVAVSIAAYFIMSNDANEQNTSFGAQTNEERTQEEKQTVVISADATESQHVTKRTVTPSMEWPEVRNIDDRTVRRRIQSTLSFEKHFGATAEKAKQAYEQHGDNEVALSKEFGGNTGTSYRVTYDRGDLLSITVSVSGVGAYPYTHHSRYTFDLTDGDELGIFDLLDKEKEDELIARCTRVLDKRIEERKRTADISGADYEDLLSEYDGCTRDTLERFVTTRDGIRFHHDFYFGRAARALEPNEEVLIPFEEIDPYTPYNSPLSEERKA